MSVRTSQHQLYLLLSRADCNPAGSHSDCTLAFKVSPQTTANSQQFLRTAPSVPSMKYIKDRGKILLHCIIPVFTLLRVFPQSHPHNLAKWHYDQINSYRALEQAVAGCMV